MFSTSNGERAKKRSRLQVGHLDELQGFLEEVRVALCLALPVVVVGGVGASFGRRSAGSGSGVEVFTDRDQVT